MAGKTFDQKLFVLECDFIKETKFDAKRRIHIFFTPPLCSINRGNLHLSKYNYNLYVFCLQCEPRYSS